VLLPLFASLLVVFGAPYVGEIRGALQSSFPDYYRLIIGIIVAVSTTAGVAAALAQLRRRASNSAQELAASLSLRTRYVLVVVAVAVAAAYAGTLFRWNPDVALVESFHFVQYGLIACLFYRALRHRPDAGRVVGAACAGMAVGVADEWMQWFVPGRVGELHDVWLNASAVGCGLLVAVAVHPPPSLAMPSSRGSRLALAAALAGLLVGVAGFIDRVHLGYEVTDGQTGTFRSSYDAGALSAAAAGRAARWRDSPPPVRGLTREDHYLSEGQWHVQRRNTAAGTSDWFTAWNENLILERFYAPVLIRSGMWSPGERATVERHAGQRRAAYTSDAAPYPIYVIRRSVFWATTVCMSIAIIWLAGFGARSAATGQA
jgi:VanZ family protein